MKPAILVTNDGSQAALRILPHAAMLARSAAAEVVLLRVLDPDADLPDIPHADRPAVIRALTSGWKAEMAQILEDRDIPGATCVRILASAERLPEAIISASHEYDALVIAMHSRGAGAIRHALLGSTALGVLTATSLPVMLSGPQIAEPAPRRGAYRMVITSDGSPASNIVVIAMAPLLAAFEGEVRLLHLCELRSGRPAPAAEVAAATRNLETICKLLPAPIQAEVEVEVSSDTSSVADDILSAANREHADAVALSTHGHSALHHLIAGSTALDLLAKSPLPLILSRYAG